jgi:hypothetical protein
LVICCRGVADAAIKDDAQRRYSGSKHLAFVSACSRLLLRHRQRIVRQHGDIARREAEYADGARYVLHRPLAKIGKRQRQLVAMMMSPTLMPMRSTICRSAWTPSLNASIPRWVATAQATASTTLANSTSSRSPVVLGMRP